MLRAGPDPEVVVAEAFAAMATGECRQLVHIVYWWDAEAGVVATDGYAAGSARFSGRLVRVDGAWVLETSGRRPDGSTTRFRDVPGFTREDAYSTVIGGTARAGSLATKLSGSASPRPPAGQTAPRRSPRPRGCS